MPIDLKIISELRDKTGIGINDCKAALEESGGDISLAIEILRKKGELKAAKKADRAAKEGVIAFVEKNGRLAVVTLNCETDFVARTDDFNSTVENFAAKLLELTNEAAFRAWAEEYIKNELVMKIGENLQLGGCGIFSGPVIGSYLHSNKKIAGVVIISGGAKELAKDLAMQVAAMSPRYLNPESVPAADIDKEKEIYREQLKNENKPEAIWDKIIDGKLAKFYEENCLGSQRFIKDDDKKIKDLLGANQLISFARFQV